MPNKKTTKKSAPQKQPKHGATKVFIKKNAGLIILVLIVVAALVFIGARNFAITQERKQYDNAAAELEKLSQDIVGIIGQPVEITRDRSCAYSNAKFSKGNLRCSIVLELSTSVDNLSRVIPEIENYFSEKYGLDSIDSRSSLPLVDTLKCSVAKNESSISFSCYGDPNFEVYPVVD